MKFRALFTLKLVLLALLAVVLYFTNDLFLLVGSSASISHLIAPSWVIQTIEYLLCAICLLIPAHGSRRIALFIIVAVVFALLSGHRLIFDNFNHRLTDMYLAMPAQTIPLNPEITLQMRLDWAGASVNQADGGSSHRIVSPIFFGLDRKKLAALNPP